MRNARGAAARHHGSSGAALMGSKLGINIGQIGDYEDQQLTFVNIIKNARCFGPISNYFTWNNDVALDSNGWPTVDFGVILYAAPTDPLGRTPAVNNPGMVGTYKLSFTGQATLASSDCVISNKVYTAGTNTTTADVTFNGTSVGGLMTLEFSGTTGGCQNIILNRPGYAIGTTQVFTTALLNALAPFSCMRFMDFTQTNNNSTTDWATRTQVTSPLQGRTDSANVHGKGAAWEYAIMLANTTGKDIWVNVPYSMDPNVTVGSTYVTALATLLHTTLNAGIHVYVEYSNEVWNDVFEQAQDMVTVATNSVSAGDPFHLNWDSVNDIYTYRVRMYAQRTKIISDIFKTVYGTTAFNSTVRVVLMCQGAVPYFVGHQLKYLNQWYGAPSGYLYGIGGDGYVQCAYNTTFSTLTALFTSLNTVNNGSQIGYNAKIPFFAATPAFNGTGDPATTPAAAAYWGLKSICYEGGLDLDPSGPNGTSAVAENSLADSRTTTLETNMVTTWFNNHNDLWMWYQFAAGPGQYWGLYEDISVPSPKSIAMATLAATVLPP